MRKAIYIIGILSCILSCAEHDDITGGGNGLTPISIGGSYPSAAVQTRAVVDGGFVTGDEMGIFIVDRDNEGQPGNMALQGNRASNIRFILQDDGSWQAATQLYWDTKGRSADFYGYYPFDGLMQSVSAQPFTVLPDQSDAADYTASDLLWAKRENVAPTTETISLQYHHLMAGIAIHIESGNGFTADEWAALEKTVFVASTIAYGTVDMATGDVTPGSSQPTSIRPLLMNGTYRAVVIPQTVAAGQNLLQIHIDGHTYHLKKQEPMVYTRGKMHQFTVTVDRNTDKGDYTVSLADEAIIPWVDDAELHEGLVRQYVVVDVTEPGTLGTRLKQQVSDLTKIKNLKVTGTINQDDQQFMWNEVTGLERLNLLKAVLSDGILNGPQIGFDIPRHHPLEEVIFPEKSMKEIDGFFGTSLKGSLVIPEGVERLGWSVFGANYFTGTLSLPSTLKYTAGFGSGNLHGEFHMPENMVEWAGVQGNFTGTMYLPPTLKKIGGPLPTGLTGTIVIPQGCEISDNAFSGSQCTAVILPEGLKEINGYCFRGSSIAGELVLPSTLEKIGGEVFSHTNISRIIFPDALKTIEEGIWQYDGSAFGYCDRLTGTLELPKNVARIPKLCFQHCSAITGLVIPKGVLVLDMGCFRGCYSIASIVCEAEEPPYVAQDVFLGVPKDNFTVEVPKGCVEAYRNAPGWSEFKRISEYSNFVCRPAQAQALNNRHEEQLVLNADDQWKVTDKPAWVSLSQTEGKGKSALTLIFQPLTHGDGPRTGVITFSMGDYTTTCKVSQYDYDYDEDSYLTLQKASKGNRGGIDIVFVGDGYDGQAISDGTYLDLIKHQTECFFAIEPYKSMREYFNVYVTFPLSQEKGVNTMYTYVNNRFGTLQGFSSLLTASQVECTSTQLIMEVDKVQQYVIEKTPVKEEDLWRTLVIAVPNSTEYEGNTVFNNSGLAISICPPSEQPYPRDTRGTIQHEAGGHGFGKLGDETITRNAFATTCIKNSIDEKHRQGWYANLSTTGKLSSVPWAEFVFDPDYSDYVDVFEGGYGFTRGIFRPEANSCMNYGIPYYNTPSRLSIYRRILDYAGEEYSMAKFRAQDTFEWGATVITRSTDHKTEGLTPITSGNHHEPTITRFREVGDKVRAIREKNRNKLNDKR